MSKPSQTGLHLADFLASFDATGLGEGDIDAGANLLAAMAVTLGNLARPGSGIRPPGGRLLPVGANLLATGPVVSSLVVDEVVAPVGRCQDNLLAQLARLLKDDAAERARGTLRRWVLSKGPKSNAGENALFQLMTGDPDLPPPTGGSHVDGWMAVLSEPPAHRLDDLVRHPRCFIAAHTRSCLEKLLPDAHLGEAMVCIGLARAADAAGLGDLCPPLMDGLFPGGPAGELVRGRLVVTDHGRVLREVAASPDDRNGWLARLVWLVEGGTAPGAPPPPENGGGLRLPNLTGRFEEAVRATVANRLNSHDPRPVTYTHDISRQQTRWMEFLRGMEKDLPGIPGTARSLFPSLAFGLLRLANTAEMPKGFRFQVEGVLAFAKHLIHRMAAARHEMLWSPEQERRLELKRKLVERLADGPQEVGGLVRRFHRLRASLCHELLYELEEEGEAVPVGGRWKLAG